MIRTVVSIVLFVLLIVGCVWIYRIVNHESVPGNGEVLVRSTPEHDQMESGATFIDDKPIEAQPTPSRSDAPGTINTEPAAEYNSESGSTSPAPVPPQPEAKAYTPVPYSPQPYAATPYNPTSLPATDTLAPNAPNGLAFAGTGAYQWYRQGDLTWRVDTKTGASCIDYATMEEWRKPIVYSHGCGSSGGRGHIRAR